MRVFTSLKGNQIGDNGAEAIAEALRFNGAIRTLELWYGMVLCCLVFYLLLGNPIGDATKKKIKELEKDRKKIDSAIQQVLLSNGKSYDEYQKIWQKYDLDVKEIWGPLDGKPEERRGIDLM
jgi:hypothetical protein